MNRFVLRLLVPVLLLCAVPATARDMNGKFGVGYDQSLGGVSGLNLKYHVGNIGIWGTLGFDLFKPAESDPRTAVRFAVAALYDFARFEVVNLGVGIRADVGWRNGEAVTADRRKAAGCATGTVCPLVQEGGSIWQVNLEIPLVAEVFFTDHFALHVATGLTFTILMTEDVALPQETGRLSTDTKEKGFGFGIGNGSLFGSAGFTVYF